MATHATEHYYVSFTFVNVIKREAFYSPCLLALLQPADQIIYSFDTVTDTELIVFGQNAFQNQGIEHT